MHQAAVVVMCRIGLEDEEMSSESGFPFDRCVQMEKTEGGLNAKSWDSNLEVHET